MLAVIQRCVAGLLFIGVAGGGWLAWRGHHLAWTLAAPALIAAGYAGALALEFLWLRRSYPRGSPDLPSARQLVAAWVTEVAIGPRIFLWRQPFRSRVIGDWLPEAARGRRGVVFVHGFFCNRGFWIPWLARCRARNTPFVAISLEPVFGSIDDYAPLIDSAVRRLHTATGRPPVIVAHSMGGLASRAWLTQCDDDVLPSHVVTIGTPHQGTWMARHSLTRNGVQMRLGSAWLRTLEQAEAQKTRPVPFTCFWGHCDNIVFPTRSATLPHADNRHVAGTPHIAMAFHAEVFAEVDRLVAV